MIQRIQTIYLLVAVVLSVVCLCMQIGTFTEGGAAVYSEYNLWVTGPTGVRQFVTWPLFAVLLLSAAIGLYAIFMYANRLLQARFCMFAMLLVVGWYILYVVYGGVLKPGDGSAEFAPTWVGACPLVASVFYFLARRAIMADERLVRAADRIR